MADLKDYPKTEQFEIIDTIGVPHPFCITPQHVAFASDNFSGMLGTDALEAFEKEKFKSGCGVRGCNLSVAEHETAVLVQVDDARELNDIPELQDYLLECKPLLKAEGGAGFAFIQKEKTG